MPDLLAALVRHARHRPTQPALIAPDGRSRTWRELEDLVRRIASGLRARGARPGDGVLIGLFHGDLAPIAFLAAQAAGLVPVVVGPGAAPTLTTVTGALRVVEAVVGPELGDAVPDGIRTWQVGDPTQRDALLAELCSGNPLAHADPRADGQVSAIQFSTGSTGTPKGIVRTVAGEYADALGRCLTMGVREQDRWLSVSATNTNVPIGALRSVVLIGGTLTLTEGTDPVSVEAASRGGVQILALQPHDWHSALHTGTVAALVERGLRIAVMTGGHPDPRTLAELEKALGGGGEVLNIYGLTEVGNVAVATARSRARSGPLHAGVVNPLLEVAATEGADGELLVRGPAVAGAYLLVEGDTVREVATLRDGWLATGDLGAFDESGGIDLRGRMRDLVTVGTTQLTPRQVELSITLATGVPEAVVLPGGSDDVDAVLVLATAALGRDLVATVRRDLADHPARWQVVALDGFPRNFGGKTDRQRLASELGRGVSTLLDLRSAAPDDS